MLKNKNMNLIVVLIATFLISNGTFFVLCEKDTILDTINRVGDWTNAILWHSSKAFLFYAAADTFYNIRYIVPKLAYAFAPIKLADKVNGWLGGSSTGELEKHLAQDKYCPLYRDFSMGTYTNVGLPLYNNIWNPFLGYLGIRPLIREISVPIFVNRVSVEYRDRLQIRTEYRTRDNENILSVRDSLENLRTTVNQNSIITNNLQQNFADLHAEIGRLDLLSRLEGLHIGDLLNICRTDNAWLPSNHQLVRIVEDSDEFFLSGGEAVNGLRVYYKSRSIFGNANAEHSLLISGAWFYNTYPNLCALFKGYSQNAVTHEICIAYKNNSIDSANCSFINVETSESVKIVDYIRENSLSSINTVQTEVTELIARVDYRLNGISGRRSNQGSQTDNLSERSVVLDQVGEFLDNESQASLDVLSRQDPSDSIFGVSSTNLSANATMGALGLVGSISLLPLNDVMTIFAHFLGMSTFEPLLANPEAVKCIINIYYQATGSIPGVLADYAIANPQEFSSADFLNTPSAQANSLPNNGLPIPSFTYIGTGLAILGVIGVTWYLTKYGMDASPVVETAKTFKESLQEKYVNFK